jgi:hypothetical protein
VWRDGATSGPRRDAAEGAQRQVEKRAFGEQGRVGVAFATAERITWLPNRLCAGLRMTRAEAAS